MEPDSLHIHKHLEVDSINLDLTSNVVLHPPLIRLGAPETWEANQFAPFTGYLGMVEFLKCVQKQNDDALVLLDGLEGSGKSTVAFQLATALNPNWNPERGLIIDYDDWEEVYSLEPGQVFVLDEGGDLMFSRDALQRENKLVVRMFQMARIFNHIIIVCCPNLHWVDVYVRDHRALIYGHTHKAYYARGVERGMVTWNWPSRRFNWQTSEWESRWNQVGHSRFKPVPPTNRQWIAYETLKRLKVEKRQFQLQQGIKKKDRKD